MTNRVKVFGGNPLHGEIAISGAKNASLPIMAASLLCTHPVMLQNIPDIADIRVILQILGKCGVTVEQHGECSITHASRNRTLVINSCDINSFEASHELVSKMRASILVLGPLLSRFGKAKVALPGGCSIGARPIDMHLNALKQMGASIEIDGNYIIANAPYGLQGTEINFEKVSVGATENVAMAAALAKGVTIINNAAREPEVQDLLNFLQGQGVEINGIGTSRLEIYGTTELASNYCHTVIGDRIEAATYAIAACMTNGSLLLNGIDSTSLNDVWSTLSEVGVKLEVIGPDSIRASARETGLKPANITTDPYPGFPTDMQAQLMALLTVAAGKSSIKETIHDNRFLHVRELVKMGADIIIDGDTATVNGAQPMRGAELFATDLRASAALILAALALAEDQSSIINDVYHLERGYDHMFYKLAACGANLQIDKGQGLINVFDPLSSAA